MPDTLFIFITSIFLLLFLVYFPYIIWLLEGGIKINTLIIGRHKFPKKPNKILLVNNISENYKESFIIFSPIAVLSLVIIVGALGVVLLENIVYSAFLLGGVFMSVAGLYLLFYRRDRNA